MLHTKVILQAAIACIAIISLGQRNSALAFRDFHQNEGPFKSLVMPQPATEIDAQISAGKASTPIRSPINIEYPIYETCIFFSLID
jgi:hypothetical protein